MRLNETDKKDLLCLARDAIKASVLSCKSRFSSDSEVAEGLKTMCGAFVSLYVDKELRGCIGTFAEENPLFSNVKRMAVSAATTDNRFEPILPDELDRLVIEISVLTPRTRIYDSSEITIGKHGIFMTHGTKRGTLLPHVAVAQNWNAEEFLGNCSRYKAGIGWEGWKSAELYTYEALSFRSSPADKC